MSHQHKRASNPRRYKRKRKKDHSKDVKPSGFSNITPRIYPPTEFGSALKNFLVENDQTDLIPKGA